MQFKTVKAGQEWIESVYKFSDKYDLSRMEKACAMLDHPERTFKSIHIGGTNGKGSTLTYLKNIFLNNGLSVGTYTSPYIVRFNERITLNNKEIDDEALLDYINQMYALHQRYLKEENDQISFFELVTLMSFLYFRDTKPDIALIEVGLGGTLDATNVITPEMSVITNIGTDHLHVIGPTIEDVAKNKLGIVKEGVPLVTAYTQENLTALFEQKVTNCNTTMHRLNDVPVTDIELGLPTRFTFMDARYTLNMVGLHQVHNAALALLTAEIYCASQHIPLSQAAKHEAIEHAFWPGRFEVFGNIIIDGAHNKEGLESCLSTVTTYYPDKRIKSLFTVMEDKDYAVMLRMLEAVADEIIFTEIPMPRCEKAEVLLGASKHDHAIAIPKYQEALKASRPENESEVLVITGSLYFISLIRSILKEEQTL